MAQSKNAIVKEALLLKEEGNKLAEEKKFSEAAEKYQAAIKISPIFAIAWYNLGLMQSNLGDLEKAFYSFNQAVQIDPQYQKALFNLDETKKKLRIKDQEAAKFFFLEVDLQLTSEGKVKILGFHHGMRKTFDSYQEIYKKPIQGVLHEEAKLLGLPLFLNCELGEIKQNDESFLKARSQLKKSEKFDSRSITTYSAIYGGNSLRSVEDHFLCLNDQGMLQLAMEDKYAMNSLFAGELAQYRPATKFYAREFHSNLAMQIRKNFPNCQYYLLKVPSISISNCSAIVVDDLNLEKMLFLLLTKDQVEDKKAVNKVSEKFFTKKYFPNTTSSSSSQADPLETAAVKKWRNLSSSYFLVEEFVFSRKHQVDKKSFYGTVCSPILLIKDQGKITCKLLGSYWKLTDKEISNGSLQETMITTSDPCWKGFVAVTKEEEVLLDSELKKIMPQIFKRALDFDLEKKVAELQQDKNDWASVKYGGYLLTRMSSCYNHMGRHYLALVFIEQVIRCSSFNFRGYHEKGLIYHALGEYQKAIAALSEALRVGDKAVSRWRRARSYEAIEDFTQAKTDFEGAFLKEPGNESIKKDFFRFVALHPQLFEKSTVAVKRDLLL
jgi:tetratricopeptide (TPR) repeat protein